MSTSEQQSAGLKLAIVYGGKSGEHEVSLKTAAAVIGALDFSKYDVFPVYITKAGTWLGGQQLSYTDVEAGLVTAERLVLAESTYDVLSRLFSGAFDVVFPLLHGTYGEDGTIQGLCEMADVPYVGTGVLASAIGMDKVMMKKVFAAAGLPQCNYVDFTKPEWALEQVAVVARIEQELGYPCFVKPANSGSSVGISKAKQRAQLIEAVELALTFDRKIIAEAHVEAREVEVSVLGNDEVFASVVGEIVPSNEFYDYQAKYLDGKSAMVIPAELPEETAEQLRDLAVRAFRAIDGSGLSRVDFFLDKTDGSIYLNEINTMPGFTPFSMYPLLWRETGKHYQDLLDELIALAIARQTERAALRFTI